MKTPILVVFSLIGCGALAATALIPIVSPPISFTARRVQGQGQGQGRSPQGGPPPAVFRTEVPESELNVIAGSPTKTGITLTVLAKSSGNGKVTVDAAGKGVTVLDFGVESGIAKAVKIDGLRSGMEYSYNIQVVSDVKTSKFAGKFTTAKSPGQEFSFVVQADSHLDGNSDTAVYNRTLHNMVQDRPDFLVDLGDTFMVDKYSAYQESVKQYQAQRYWFSIPGSQMSVFLCLGNHDGEVGWRSRNGSTAQWCQEQRESLFPVIRKNDFYSGAPKTGLYYGFNWGDALFLVLDPFVATHQKTRTAEDGWNWTLGEDQFRWFENELRSSKAKYKFIFIHHLVGGFGKEARGGVEAADKFEWGNTKEFPANRPGWAEPIHDLMVKYKVTAMFHGHDHLYVRQEKDGVTYLEVPQPSHGRGDATRSAEEYGYTTGKLLGSSGHIRVKVSPKQTVIEYVKSLAGEQNRSVVDSLTLQPSK